MLDHGAFARLPCPSDELLRLLAHLRKDEKAGDRFTSGKIRCPAPSIICRRDSKSSTHSGSEAQIIANRLETSSSSAQRRISALIAFSSFTAIPYYRHARGDRLLGPPNLSWPSAGVATSFTDRLTICDLCSAGTIS